MTRFCGRILFNPLCVVQYNCFGASQNHGRVLFDLITVVEFGTTTETYGSLIIKVGMMLFFERWEK